jgi:hypothetical protein
MEQAGPMGADQVVVERAVRGWVGRHAVLKLTGPVRYGCGSNRRPGSLLDTRCVKVDDRWADRKELQKPNIEVPPTLNESKDWILRYR